jgi:hypothetical protein
MFMPSIYGLVVAATFVAMFAEPQRHGLHGVGVMLVTLPWSVIFSVVVNYFVPPHFFDSVLPGAVIVCLSAAVNMVLLFFIGAALDRKLQ